MVILLPILPFYIARAPIYQDTDVKTKPYSAFSGLIHCNYRVLRAIKMH